VVRAYHIIFTAYGFWLPNDPRGSWSEWVASWELLKFGRATKTDVRRSVAGKRHDRSARAAAKLKLKYRPVIFNGVQARSIGVGFADAVRVGGHVLFACSILPDHVHVVAGRRDREAEDICGHLKSAASKQLRHDGLHPFQDLSAQERLPGPWAKNCWKSFLNTPGDIRRSIDYVRGNPGKEGKRVQDWSFVSALG
jgi:REP element-mobilizing transposase RayT